MENLCLHAKQLRDRERRLPTCRVSVEVRRGSQVGMGLLRRGCGFGVRCAGGLATDLNGGATQRLCGEGYIYTIQEVLPADIV